MIIKTYPGIILCGDPKYRSKKCPKESLEQITFVNRIRDKYPKTWGILLVHPENEGKVSNGEFARLSKSKIMGMSKGAADILIPGMPSFVCEIKRQDRTLSDLSDDQFKYLNAAYAARSFVCIALGADAAENAFNDWLKQQKINPFQF